MMRARPIAVCVLALLVMLAGCSAPATPRSEPANSAGGASVAPTAAPTPKRILATIRSAPASMAQQKTNPPGLVGSVPGLDALEELVSAGLTHTNSDGVLIPQLAEAVPTVDNGLWKLFPDGRMETTWKIRSDARWQDGTPLTTMDLLFTTTVEQDKDVGTPRNPAYDQVDRIEAADASTITVSWKRPYIEADQFFSYAGALPMPEHLLMKAFTDDKATFTGAPYWSTEFVGTGPYRIREWTPDSRAVLQAFDQYALGRPRIDEIEVKFIPDPNTLMANVLAGVELTIGRALSLDQAVQLREQWREGTFTTRPTGWVPINVQFINPNPSVVTDLRFRRAMLQAIDRQQLMNSLMAGQGAIAHSYVSPDKAEYQAIQSREVRYEYDPRAAAQALEGLGYTKGSDGQLVDASGQKLTVEVYTTIQNDIHPKATAAVADYWKAVGVGVEQNIIPVQRAQDREYRALFPAFELVQTGSSLSARDVRRFHSSSTPLPENRFQVTGNNSRYRNPELDGAIDRYLTSIPRSDRTQALGDMVHHQTENLSVMGLIYFVSPTMVANRLKKIVARGDNFTEAWNAQEWDVQ